MRAATSGFVSGALFPEAIDVSERMCADGVALPRKVSAGRLQRLCADEENSWKLHNAFSTSMRAHALYTPSRTSSKRVQIFSQLGQCALNVKPASLLR